MAHRIETLWNRGWDDDPDWALVCECGWEAWYGDSEEVVRHLHAQHAREHGHIMASVSTRSGGDSDDPVGELLL